MKHPTLKGLDKVIKNLESVLPDAKQTETDNGNSVSMLQWRVSHTCDTPMCHGGWYAIAHNRTSKGARIDEYSEAAKLMAEHMGFKTSHQLEHWAHTNKRLWGNSNGRKMFASMEAFYTRTGLPVERRLKSIVDHWKKVRERVRKLKEKK